MSSSISSHNHHVTEKTVTAGSDLEQQRTAVDKPLAVGPVPKTLGAAVSPL